MTLTEAKANRDKIAAYVRTLSAVKKPSPAQLRSLAIDRANLAHWKGIIAVLSATPAELNKAWNHIDAASNIDAVLTATGHTTQEPAAVLADLGPGLFGQAICLGRFGVPGANPEVDYTLGDSFGGYWCATPEQGQEGFRINVWQASQVVYSTEWFHDQNAPGVPTSWQVAQDHGLNTANDGPA